MIVIVGHGPSAVRVPSEVIEKGKVVRLRRATHPPPGRTDIICSSQERHKQKKYEFWWLWDKELRQLIFSTLKPFKPKVPKPSTGLSAAIIARDKYPKEEIMVIGFDWTINPDDCNQKIWLHDAYAEHECLKELQVIPHESHKTNSKN